MKTNPKNTHGFTRTEALAALTTLLLLSLLAFPSSATNRGKTKSTLCLSNLRHLVFAWQLYATDHDGRLVGNFHGGDALGGAAGHLPLNAPWALGWLDWTMSRDNTNINLLRNPRYARLADYILTKKNVHKCPAENFQSYVQASNGWHRVRTVAMNGTLGRGNIANPGPLDPLYRQALNLSDLYRPAPSETTVIFDQHPAGLDDPLFFPPRATSWVEVPGNLHHGAGSFSFADGHVTLHQWQNPALRQQQGRLINPPPVLANDPDVTWMSYTSQRSRDETY